MTHDQMLAALRRANDVARRSLGEGKHPFGAVLIGADGETLLAEQGNVDAVNHAEAVLARAAASRFDAQALWRCTLVTTVEPCAMCAATMYWANIGRLVYGMSETALHELTGDDDRNPTLELPCREVFARGRKAVQVHGPFAEVTDQIAALHRGFWHSG
jgi:tRNA(Arg) A34 adenosine deaminase TadA